MTYPINTLKLTFVGIFFPPVCSKAVSHYRNVMSVKVSRHSVHTVFVADAHRWSRCRIGNGRFRS